MNLTLRIDYWTECVGTFDPLRVVQQISREFPEAVIDWNDHQAAELERILEYVKTVPEPTSTTMERQARRKAMDNGPSFCFEIPSNAGAVRGTVCRFSVSIDLPEQSPDVLRSRLESFLIGLKLGEPKFTKTTTHSP